VGAVKAQKVRRWQTKGRSAHHSRGVLLFDMRRREFITLLGGVALACPLAARAQQGNRIKRLGVLSGYRADDPEMMDRIVVFRQAMQELGWSEGRNLQIDYRWAGADAARIGSYAAELTGAPPDVITVAHRICGRGAGRSSGPAT
jgi:hypothetical protein